MGFCGIVEYQRSVAQKPTCNLTDARSMFLLNLMVGNLTKTPVSLFQIMAGSDAKQNLESEGKKCKIKTEKLTL